MSNELNYNKLKVGFSYVNNKDININKIDYSEVIKVKSDTIKTSINVLTGNGYNVVKNKVITNVSKLNYIISASGMYGIYCGTDDNENFIFKVIQNTTIIDNKNNIGIIIPINTKLILSKTSSSKYMFDKKDKLINNIDENNDEIQTTVSKVINKTYDSLTNIGKSENVIQNTGGRSYKKSRYHIKTRVKSIIKKHKTHKHRKTSKNKQNNK